MRRAIGFLAILLGLLLIPAPVSADGSQIVTVVYPPPSESEGQLVFQKIPWVPGDKVHGSIEVAISKPVRNLVVRTASGAVSLDYTSRRVIPRHRIQFYRSDIPQGAATDTESSVADPLSPTARYMFDFTVDGIPGEDTYLATMEAVGEYQSEPDGEWLPFQQPLPPLKIKVFREAVITIPGRELTEQWTNTKAPFSLLSPMSGLLRFTEHDFFYHLNPEAVVSFTLPGNPRVDSSVEHSLTVSLDPVMDENDNATPWVHFWLEGSEHNNPPEGLPATSTQTFQGLRPTDTVYISIYRVFDVDESGHIQAERIPPGIYRSNLRIKADWGSEFVLPVEIRVRDHPGWAILALVLGVIVSLMSNYWQSRQPLYQAQVKARRLQRLYVDHGIQLSVVERVIQRLNGCLTANDLTGVGQAAGLLEDLIHRLPDTMVVESLVRELEATPGVSRAQLWARFLEAARLDKALQALREYCMNHGDPAVKEFAPRFETLQWAGSSDSLTPIGAANPGTLFHSWASQLFGGLFPDWRRASVRVLSPGLWDQLTVVVLFLLVNGGLIALQMSESYAPNTVFGTSTDYLNLLFWGFAGDATRTKVTAIAGNFWPGENKAPAPAAGRGPGGAPAAALAPAAMSETPPAQAERTEPPRP